MLKDTYYISSGEKYTPAIYVLYVHPATAYRVLNGHTKRQLMDVSQLEGFINSKQVTEITRMEYLECLGIL